jgi:hypothetical protein
MSSVFAVALRGGLEALGLARPLQVELRRQATPAPSGTCVSFEVPAGLTA